MKMRSPKITKNVSFNTMTFHDIWWLLVTFDDYWGFFMIKTGDLSWIHDWSWYIMIHHDKSPSNWEKHPLFDMTMTQAIIGTFSHDAAHTYHYYTNLSSSKRSILRWRFSGLFFHTILIISTSCADNYWLRSLVKQGDNALGSIYLSALSCLSRLSTLEHGDHLDLG